ncbi:hypothetical protein [Brevibacillus massiliensis]|uniref:hypothetical protein n=1 Tax=Brevibacillus massiliensis TaxID=1118054 RepID=UPI0003120C57|nr:hypothetical protein [Brevibacillus massiliensis]
MISYFLLAFFLPLFVHVFAYPPVYHLIMRRRLCRLNFARKLTPTAGGLVLLVTINLSIVALLGFFYWLGFILIGLRSFVMIFIGSVAVALWGLQDDRSTDRGPKGLRGHLQVLWKEQRFTSGLLKAWGIGGTSLIVSMGLSSNFWEMLVHTGLLALSANMLNLFDLRPGRAIKVFWMFSLAVMLATPLVYDSVAWILYLPVLSATIWFFIPEMQRMIMLGDTGANYLGFLLGVLFITGPSFIAKIVILILLMILHAGAEFFSISKVIGRYPLLHLFDKWGAR